MLAEYAMKFSVMSPAGSACDASNSQKRNVSHMAEYGGVVTTTHYFRVKKFLYKP